MFKKTLLSLILLLFVWTSNISIVNADTPLRGFGLNNDNVTWISNLWVDQVEDAELIDVVKSFINWVLGILSLIALIIILYAGFKMVTANGDETKYKDGFKIIQQAAVWLAVIWLSWFIVSMIFWLIQESTSDNNWGWWEVWQQEEQQNNNNYWL